MGLFSFLFDGQFEAGLDQLRTRVLDGRGVVAHRRFHLTTAGTIRVAAGASSWQPRAHHLGHVVPEVVVVQRARHRDQRVQDLRSPGRGPPALHQQVVRGGRRGSSQVNVKVVHFYGYVTR